MTDSAFEADCRRCPRLVGFLTQVKAQHPSYHARPVAPFGVERPHLLIIGLAPGMHGANATGRPFTGDHAGILLYETLHQYGFSDRPVSHHREDGMQLLGCRITNAVKCLPPANKPSPQEVRTCSGYLRVEMQALAPGGVVLALGNVAHGAVIRALGYKLRDYAFAHGAKHSLPDGRWLLNSYHCSRYNTQTKRLTTPMFQAVFAEVVSLLNARGVDCS